MKYIYICLTLTLISLSNFAQASDDFKISGFATLSAVKTNKQDIEFIQNNTLPSGADDHWSFDNDTVLGIQGQYQISDKLSGVVQLLSRRNYKNNYQPSLDWAYISYKYNPNLRLRAGRFVSPVFLGSDTRNVNYSNVWVRPVIDLYSQATINNIDGVDAIYSNFIGDGDVSYQIQAYAGKFDKLYFPGKSYIKFHHMAGLVGTVQYDSWTFRAGYMNAQHSTISAEGDYVPGDMRMLVSTDYQLGLSIDPQSDNCAVGACSDVVPNADDVFSIIQRKRRPFNLTSLAVVYDNGSYFGQFEWAHRKADSALSNGIAAYGMVGYRFDSLTPYVGYSYAKSLTENFKLDVDADIKASLDSQVVGLGSEPLDQYVVRNSSSRSNTITAGLRWDFYKKMALKMQFDSFRPLNNDGLATGGSGFLNLTNETLSATGKNIIVSTVSLDIIF